MKHGMETQLTARSNRLRSRMVRRSLIFFVLGCLCLGCGLIWAVPIHFSLYEAVVQPKQITVHQAVQQVKSRYPGSQILGAESVQTDSGTTYLIKIVTSEGVVKQVRINAEQSPH